MALLPPSRQRRFQEAARERQARRQREREERERAEAYKAQQERERAARARKRADDLRSTETVTVGVNLDNAVGWPRITILLTGR